MSDPYDGQISMNSLRALEEMAGIEILTKLAQHQEKFARIVLNARQQSKLEGETERLEAIIDQWKSAKSRYPPTWHSLLGVLNLLNLGELGQQIEDYFG